MASVLDSFEAPNSKLPYFDKVIPNGVDPSTMAKGLMDDPSQEARKGSILDTFESPAGMPIPQPISQPPTPVVSQPAINPAAYDPLALFGKIVPKASAPKPLVTKEESSGAMLALNKVWGLAKNPYDVVKGTAEFVASVPGFIEGVVAATWEASKAIGKGANLSETYDAASKGMEEMSADWKYKMVDPLGRLLDTPKTLGKLAAEKITGAKSKPEEDYSGVVGDIAMAPLNLVSKAAHSVADAEWMNNYPNIKGAIKFGGDAIGLLFMGRLYKGGSAEFAKDVEPIITKAEAINKQQKVVDEIPNEVLKKAEEKVLEVQKVQLELEAKRLQDKIDHEKIVAEDLKAKGQEVKDIKDGKVPAETTVEEELLSNTEFDDSLLGDLGYNKDEIAQMSVEERANILKVDESVSPLNELDSFEPAKSGVDILEPKVNVPTKIGIDTNNIPNKDLQPLVDRIYKTYDKNEHLGELDYPEGFFKTGKKADQVEIIQDFIDANAEDVGLLYETFGDLGKPKTKTGEIKAITTGTDILEPKKAKVIKRKAKVDIAQEELNTIIGDRTPREFIQGLEEGINKPGTSEAWKKQYAKTIDKINKLDSIVNKKAKTKEEVKPVEQAQPIPITDLDLQTGTPLPESLSTQAHPFRDKSPEHTNTMKTLLQERVNNIDATPEVFTRYLINEVNRHLNGEDVPIGKVRDGISELAARADSLRSKFDRGEDFEAWRDTVKAAASWARGADRLTNKRTGVTNLNMMIPINEAPKIVKDLLKNIKGAAQDIYRNKEVFDKTGFWLAKDGKWRYEIDDSKMKVDAAFLERNQGKSLNLSGIVSDSGLFEAVPKLKDTKVEYTKVDYEPSTYEERTNTVHLTNTDKSNTIHEIQHAINEKMKSRFTGANPVDSSMEGYLKDPGEMESRLSETRMNMNAKERKKTPPWETLEDMLTKEGWKEEYDELPNGQYDIRSVKGPGSTLYMGLDPTQLSEATKNIIAGAKALANYTAKARGMKDWNPKAAAQNIKEELVRSFVDRSGNIRKDLLDKLGQDGYEIIQKMYLSKGASSLAAQQLKQMRKEVYDGLSKNEKRILDNLILADRMLDIGKYKTAAQFKFPEGLSPVESASYNELFQFTEKITPEKADLLKQRAASYFDWMKKPLQDMLDAELIDQTEYDALASHNYRRLKLVDVFDKRYQSKVGKTKRTVYDSGVESLSHGRETDVFEPSSEVMALEVFNRAYGRILNNAANRTLLDLARADKDNPFVAVKDSATDRVPSGWDRVFVYEKGERKALYLSPEMSKEWITNNPEMSYKMSQMIRYASGSPVLRTFATGIDWDFALRNLPRDVMHIWYAARVFEDGKWKPLYNTASPVYAYQMSADLAGVFHDATLRKGKYLDYIKEGGGMEFLVHQGRLMQRGRHIEGNIDKVQNVLGYVGETSEIMTRLAIRDRVIRRRAAEQGISYEDAYKDKKITQEATFVARDYMDFGQGGGITKALDNGIPYLNASVVGTRGLFRAFKDNPTQSVAKLAQFATVVTGLYIAANQFNPKTMQALQGDMITQSNIVLPLGDEFSFQDEKGQTRYIYLKLLPLDPGQKFFKKFFEASTDKWLGNPVDVDGTINALEQFSPVGVSSLPPTVAGALGYTYNKNFWSAEDIWKKTDKPMGWPNSKEEYAPGKTPQAFQDFGSLTGMSPERTKYAVSQLFTSGTMWGQLVGAGYDAVFGDLPKKYKEMHIAEILSKMPITKNFIGITNPYTQFATPINEAKEQAMLKRWIENRGLDQRVESFLYEGGKESGVIDYINTTAKDQITQDRLHDRFEFQKNIKDLPNRAFWLSLKSIPDTEARAKVYVQRFDSASPSDQAVIDKEVTTVEHAGGVISAEFKKKVMEIRDANARAKEPHIGGVTLKLY